MIKPTRRNRNAGTVRQIDGKSSERAILFLFLAIILLSMHGCSIEKEQSETPDSPESIVISGKISRPQPVDDEVKLIINRPGFSQKILESKTDSSGGFRFEFASYVPTDAYISYQTLLRIGVKPGDSLHVEFDGALENDKDLLQNVKYSGDRATFNEQLTKFLLAYDQRDVNKNDKRKEVAVVKYEQQEFKIFADSLHNERQEIYEKFIADHNPVADVRDWAELYLKKEYFSDLTFYPESHRKALVMTESEWNVPLAYYDYLNDVAPLDKNALLATSIISAMADFRLFRDIQSAKTVFDDDTPQHAKDSITLYSIGGRSDDPLLREIELSFWVYIQLAQLNAGFYERYKTFIEKNITHRFLIEPITEKYEQVVEDIQQKEMRKSDLLSGIIDAHKGQVIYVDVWATWCKPCYEEFPYSKRLQKEFEEVVFVYVCVDSEEEAFKSAREKYQLSGIHYFMDADKSNLLRSQLNIDGIPQYLLIDKNGQVVSQGFKDRPSADHTREKMKELMEDNS
ncbi:MAG: TlpA family protein disulfide reductase [Cyclobacteriaceae bacterium]|nr:TlpA family protein disulfide reductase [Cyclobacteriaceae bacterium]